MSARDGSLLRWYPASWRERYGAEMLAMIEDGLGGERPSVRLQLSLLAAGVHEHLRRAAVTGSDRPPAERRRAGALVVAVGWAMMAVAGCVFAKVTEHWTDAVRGTHHAIAGAAFDAIVVLAVAAAVVVILATLAAVPALRRALAGGAWRALRRSLGVAAGMVAADAGVTAALAVWAHRLTSAQRNGGLAVYSVAFVGWGLLCVATIAAWTALAIRVERRLDPAPRLARIEAVAATAVGLATAAITVAMVTWWVALAVSAPWTLTGRPPGTASSPWAWPLGGVAFLAAGASAIALTGAVRIVRAGPDCR